MNTSPWPQDSMGKQMEEITTSNNSSNKITAKAQGSSSVERKVRPEKDEAVNCPRCNSTNTKFCYYNNYSLTQPRYFCKTCRRYWTEGGSLRNIPVGGGSRKNKRPASSYNSNTSKMIKIPDLVLPNPNSKIQHHGSGQDLNLACFSDFMQLPINMNHHFTMPMHISDPNSLFPSGFNLNAEFKPSLNFSVAGLASGGCGLHGGAQENTSGVTTANPTTSTTTDHQDNQQITRDHHLGDSTVYWTGILGGAGSW